MCIASCLPSAASCPASPAERRATSTPDLAEPGRQLVVEVAGRPRPGRPRARRVRRRLMFSPITRDRLRDLVGDRPAGGRRSGAAAAPPDRPGLGRQRRRSVRTSSWKVSLRATKSVSALTSTRAPRRAVERDPDQALAGDAGRPSWPPPPGPSCAASRSPLEVALGLASAPLAVHHAGAGLLAQFLDQSCGDLGHRICYSLMIGPVGRRPPRARSGPLATVAGLDAGALGDGSRRLGVASAPRTARRPPASLLDLAQILDLADVDAPDAVISAWMPSSTAADHRSQ